jgi:hypothetical protein
MNTSCQRELNERSISVKKKNLLFQHLKSADMTPIFSSFSALFGADPERLRGVGEIFREKRKPEDAT